MNWIIEHIDEDGYVLIEAEGYFTEGDNLVMLEDLIHQPYWMLGKNVLRDCRQRADEENEFEYLRKISRNFLRLNSSIGAGKIALLMKSIGDFEPGKNFEMLTDEQPDAEVRIFVNETLAAGWVKNASKLT